MGHYLIQTQGLDTHRLARVLAHNETCHAGEAIGEEVFLHGENDGRLPRPYI